MAELLQDLRRRIATFIAPAASSLEPPACSVQQLVAMAVLSKDTASTEADISEWISRHFAFFEYVRSRNGPLMSHRGERQVRAYKERFCMNKNTLCQIDMPLEEECLGTSRLFSMSAANGERLLESVLGRENGRSGGTFPLFQLPGELRTFIYELVFGYPRSGLTYIGGRRVGRGSRSHWLVPGDCFGVMSRDFNAEFSFAKRTALDETRYTRLETPTMSHILAPLLTSRQFYQEAMPIFYSINLFYCEGLYGLKFFLTRTAAERRKHISQIAVVYERHDDSIAAETFGMLKQIVHLKKLHIHIDEHAWLAYGAAYKLKTYTNIARRAGLGTLRTLKVQEVHFSGCPTVEKALKKDMLKPAMEQSTKIGAKKRKAKDDDNKESAGGSGEGKKAKMA